MSRLITPHTEKTAMRHHPMNQQRVANDYRVRIGEFPHVEEQKLDEVQRQRTHRQSKQPGQTRQTPKNTGASHLHRELSDHVFFSVFETPGAPRQDTQTCQEGTRRKTIHQGTETLVLPTFIHNSSFPFNALRLLLRTPRYFDVEPPSSSCLNFCLCYHSDDGPFWRRAKGTLARNFSDRKNMFAQPMFRFFDFHKSQMAETSTTLETARARQKKRGAAPLVHDERRLFQDNQDTDVDPRVRTSENPRNCQIKTVPIKQLPSRSRQLRSCSSSSIWLNVMCSSALRADKTDSKRQDNIFSRRESKVKRCRPGVRHRKNILSSEHALTVTSQKIQRNHHSHSWVAL